MQVIVDHKGDFSKTMSFLKTDNFANIISILNKYGEMGVNALSSATPVESSKTANSWYYKIEKKYEIYSLQFYNSNINKGVPIAIILQYGHGTGTGGWVEGRDYINPSIQPIFDRIAEELWMEVGKK